MALKRKYYNKNFEKISSDLKKFLDKDNVNIITIFYERTIFRELDDKNVRSNVKIFCSSTRIPCNFEKKSTSRNLNNILWYWNSESIFIKGNYKQNLQYSETNYYSRNHPFCGILLKIVNKLKFGYSPIYSYSDKEFNDVTQKQFDNVFK